MFLKFAVRFKRMNILTKINTKNKIKYKIMTKIKTG